MLSEGITSVGLSAFWGMSSITSLSLPSTLTSIEGYAFGDCTGLKEITSNAKIAPTLGEDVFKTSASSGMDWNYIGLNCKLIVPEGCAANYQGTSTWTYWDAFANVEEVVSVETLTTAASGFATYAASYPVNYKELGLTAYAIALDEAAQKVAYQEIEGVVPANTPVLVKGEASRGYSLAKAADDAVAVSTDLLVSDGNMVAENGLYYVFATVEGKSGFKILADGLTIPTKKCYLKLSESNAKSFFEIGTEATGISLEKTAIAAKNGVLYNLAGVRVPETAKGVLVRNGKKFVNK